MEGSGRVKSNESPLKVPSAGALLVGVLGLVACAHVAAQVAVDLLAPLSPAAELALETVLLALMAAGPVWWLVVRPLRGAARAERERAATLVARAAEGIVTLDGEGRVTSFNPAAERMFGRPAAEVVGTPWTDLVPRPEGRVPEGCAVLRPAAGPEPVETEALRADGTAFAAELTVSALGGDGARACIVRDISERKAAERALRESRQMLRLVLDAIPVRVFWKDADSVYLGCNGSCARDAGLEHPGQIVGRTDHDLGWREHAGLYRTDDRAVIDTGVAKVNYEEPLTLPDGGRMWLQTSKVPLTDSDGNVVGVMGCYADITERKRTEAALERALEELEVRVRQRTADLEAANARLTRAMSQRRATGTRLRLVRGLLDRTDDGLFVSDAHTGRLVDVNAAACQRLGYTRRQLLGLSVWDVTTSVADLDGWRELAARLASGPPATFETSHRRADGTEYPAEVSTAHIGVDGRAYVVAVARDISARKGAEAELVAAKEEAERANRAKSEFLSRISHELRTPLNAILGFAQLVARAPAGPAGEAAGPGGGRYADEILGAGGHLLTLVNEMLDLARVEAGTLELEIRALPVAPAAAEAAALLAPLAAERRVTVDNRLPAEGAPWVRADPTRLREILLNLVSNGIKYNREGGRVTVSCAGRPDGRVAVTVADTGRGIAPDRRDGLFEPFDRLGMEHTAVTGTGIGLAICRQIAAAMGGDIEVESAPDRGSRFTLVLPAAPPAPDADAPPVPAAEAAPALPAPGSDPRTVLYIEDNAANMALVQEVLRARPHVALLSATRGLEGLEAARRAVPDLILLDLNLPDLSGFEVLERLRADLVTRAIPVVGVSANSFPEDLSRARDAGFADYVTKPFDVGRFLATVEAHLAGAAPRGWPGEGGSV